MVWKFCTESDISECGRSRWLLLTKHVPVGMTMWHQLEVMIRGGGGADTNNLCYATITLRAKMTKEDGDTSNFMFS